MSRKRLTNSNKKETTNETHLQNLRRLSRLFHKDVDISPMLTRSDDLRILCVFFNFMRNYMPKQRKVLC